MLSNTPLVIEPGCSPARLRLELAEGEVIYLDIRVTADRGVEVGVAPPVRLSLVQTEPSRAEESSPRPFDDPNFAQRLVEHMHRAKRTAIAEAKDAGLHGEP